MGKYAKYWYTLIGVLIVTFSLLGYYGAEVYRTAPPIPGKVLVQGSDKPLYTEESILDGQTDAVFAILADVGDRAGERAGSAEFNGEVSAGGTSQAQQGDAQCNAVQVQDGFSGSEWFRSPY